MLQKDESPALEKKILISCKMCFILVNTARATLLYQKPGGH